MASSRKPKRARLSGLDVNVTSLHLTSLSGSNCSMAMAPSGTRFVYTSLALSVISKCGMQALLTGHRTEKGFTDGQGSEARFNSPNSITVDCDGNALVSDTDSHALRKITLCGAVSTLAGNGQTGFADGVGAAARFNESWGIVVDAQDAIFVSDSENHCVRKLAPGDKVVTTLVDVGEEFGFPDGQRADARFNSLAGLALDTDNHLIVGDVANDCIRKVMTAEGRVMMVAGRAGQEGFANFKGAAARFNSPHGVAVDGNTDDNILVNSREEKERGCAPWVGGDERATGVEEGC